VSVQQNTQIVKQTAARLGFDFCGIAKAEKLDDDARRLENWLLQNRHGSMHYMENNFDLRVNPTLLVAGAKSVITILYNYYPSETQQNTDAKISYYAYGQDYHEVIRKKLHEFLFELRSQIGNIEGRGFVDSAPVLERSWAQKAGLGWVGKNGNLINKQQGSFFFIATLIVDVTLQPDLAFAKDYCGTCTKCIEACPTEAILPNKIVDGSKCISYYTIELKDALAPQEVNTKNWLFGCDACQTICPWNRFSQPNSEAAFKPLHEILNYKKADWESLTEEKFKEIFRHSPIKRTKFTGIQRNLKMMQ
jgi:epoxyqueuosine reductase